MFSIVAPGSAPRNVKARPHSPQTILIDWEEPEIPNGVIQGYKVFYTTNPDLPIVLWHNQEVTGDSKMATISGLQPDATYTICVLAYSSMGQGPLSIPSQVMTTQGVPLQPRNLQAKAISPNEIEIMWSAPEDVDKIISYTLYYNNSDKSLIGSHTIYPPTTKYKLSELTPDTVYNIQLAGRSVKGEGARTILVQEKTPEFTPGAPPQAVSGRPLSHSSVLLEWKPPPSDKQNGNILGYKVLYVVNEDGKTEADAQSVEVTKTEAVLEKLHTYTEYKFWVLAYTAAGDSPMSPPVRVVTHESVPNEPKKVNVQEINSTTIYVDWRPPRAKDRNGIIRGYYVYYTVIDDNGDPIRGQEQLVDTVDGNKNEMVITGLRPATRYQVSVAAYTRKGDGVRSRPKIVSTKGAVPSEPRHLVAELVQQDPPIAQVSWYKPDLPNGEIQAYKLYWGLKGELYTQHILKAHQQSFFTPPIERGQTYEFRVLAKNDIDYGERAVVELVTPDGVPQGAPQNFSAVGLTETAVRLAWDLPAKKLRNGQITMYQLIFYQLVDSINVEELNISADSTQKDIENLATNTDYVFQIKAYTEKGAGPWSSRLQFRTFGKQPPVPENLKVQRTSPTTILVTWDEPLQNNIIEMYRVHYNDYEIEDITMWLSVDTDGPATVVQLTNLEPHKPYIVRVRAKSIHNRWSNLTDAKTVNFLNSDFKDAVNNFQASGRGSRQLTLSWEKPMKNDVSNYQIEYQGEKQYIENGEIQTRRQPPKTISVQGKQDGVVIDRLEPKMRYQFTITPVFQDAPEKVEPPTANGVRAGKVTVQLAPASEIDGPLSHYDLVVVPIELSQRRTQDFTLKELEFVLGTGQQEMSFHNRPLDPDTKYKVFLRAYTVKKNLFMSSEYSSDIEVKRNNPQDPQYEYPDQDILDNGDADEAVGTVATKDRENFLFVLFGCIAGGALLIVIGCVVFCVVVRKKSTRKEKVPEQTTKLIVDNIPPHPTDPVEMRRQHYQTPAMISHPPIPIHMLAEHIESLKAADNLKFSQEYESIEPGQQFTWDNSNLEYNKPKNRYANVIAYDHSRGPLPETFGDFWRMVWEQRCATIVMMTKLEERSRIKCDQYWPGRGAETYGLMHVLLVDVTELATYTIRTFHLQRYGVPEKREVRQFQFTAWPDHGVPDHPTPLLMFMRRVKSVNPPDAGPIICHCSAGVGRTGAFIVIDAMLERIKHEKTVDIYGHVTCLRAQRNYMVQTEDQYIFIHDALLEAVTCGNTEVPARSLSPHIQKLMQPDPGETVTGMELEFKVSEHEGESQPICERQPANESTRVALQPIRGVDGSDYINASFINGYRYRRAYVATQGPLADTTEDFWRMLWEHNSTIIEKCHQYWPSERSARYQYFVVDPMAEYNMPQYILREFKVTDARDGQSRTIRQFQFTDWPEQGVPKSGEGFIDFIGQVHKTKEQFGQEGPITVHCSAGVGRTGVFITLSIVLERMRYEGVVDMFQTVKMLRTQRPAMVQTEDQYQFCYRAALEYLGSFDHYAN
ncbi:LAR-like protein [Mya arenaria]|uniref:LAR-like protein n=1 Tax=Mya arenaria TaxID=6604 RepID=A0ABY7FL93_MYAAR|nr:LAR-like protein [Mya arenaria]